MVSEWQPIDTAPKDGTHILACPDARYDATWTFAQAPPFVVHYWDNPGEEGFYLSSGGGDLDAICPGYWQPLPPPPQS